MHCHPLSAGVTTKPALEHPKVSARYCNHGPLVSQGMQEWSSSICCFLKSLVSYKVTVRAFKGFIVYTRRQLFPPLCFESHYSSFPKCKSCITSKFKWLHVCFLLLDTSVSSFTVLRILLSSLVSMILLLKSQCILRCWLREYSIASGRTLWLMYSRESNDQEPDDMECFGTRMQIM